MHSTFLPIISGPFSIREDDLAGEATRSLLAFHLNQMHANSPAGAVFALDLSGLKAPNVTVWSVWRESEILSVGALKQLDDMSGELKSMRTHPDRVRQGAADALLQHIIAEATRRGLWRLSLETGTGPHFDAALAMYKKRGFVSGEGFSDYTAGEFNQFFHLDL